MKNQVLNTKTYDTNVNIYYATMVGIYKITNPNGRVYIGQSTNIEKRFWYYKKLHCKSQRGIYQSLIKYGIESHKFSIEHVLPKDISRAILDRFEILYMDLYKSAKVLLMNMRGGGDNREFSEASKALMSKSAKNKYVSPEALERLRFYANNPSDSTRKRRSEAQMGNKHRLGLKHSAEDLLKMSKALEIYSYVIVDKEGKEYKTTNLSVFCKSKNLTQQLLGNTFRGHYANGEVCNHHKGYKIISKIKTICNQRTT